MRAFARLHDGFAASSRFPVLGAAAAGCALLASLLLLLISRLGWQELAALAGIVALGIFVWLTLNVRRRMDGINSKTDAAIHAEAADAILRFGPNLRILSATPGFAALLGETPASLVGRTASEIVHPDDVAELQRILMQASHFEHAGEVEARLKQASGTLWTEWRCQPHGDDGEILVSLRDIVARKERERALIEARDLAEAASRAKSGFLANMSHELRTPLNAIIGFSEVMSREMFGPLGNVRYGEYSRLIHESGAHLLELINGVLDMSKIEAGKFEISEQCFDFTDMAKEALRFVKLSADRKGVVLKAALARSASTIFADRRALKQMLVNLLSNAIKFTPRGGEVRITAARATRGIEIAVSDTGAGIAPEDLARLGRPFEQAERRYTHGQEGTGLGLSLVRALVEMHGGEMTIESTLGEGTIVRLHLPYAAMSQDGVRLETPALVTPMRQNNQPLHNDGERMRGAA